MEQVQVNEVLATLGFMALVMALTKFLFWLDPPANELPEALGAYHAYRIAVVSHSVPPTSPMFLVIEEVAEEIRNLKDPEEAEQIRVKISQEAETLRGILNRSHYWGREECLSALRNFIWG